MPAAFLPYFTQTYHTALPPAEVHAVLQVQVGTGISLISSKPYYGTITAYDFAVRKRCSKIKKEGLGVSVGGHYTADGASTKVTLTVKPHPAILVALLLFGFPCLMFMARCLQAFLTSWDVAIVLNGLMPLALIYGIVLAIFNAQKTTVTRFWEHALQLRPVTP